jgi:hypothetical protein
MKIVLPIKNRWCCFISVDSLAWDEHVFNVTGQERIGIEDSQLQDFLFKDIFK